MFSIDKTFHISCMSKLSQMLFCLFFSPIFLTLNEIWLNVVDDKKCRVILVNIFDDILRMLSTSLNLIFISFFCFRCSSRPRSLPHAEPVPQGHRVVGRGLLLVGDVQFFDHGEGEVGQLDVFHQQLLHGGDHQWNRD